MLGIAYDSINANEHDEPATTKPQRAISRAELDLFNRDLDAIAAQYASEPVRVLLEKYQNEALVVARNTMYSARQPYGGANALGNEITMRALRPVDINAHGVNVHIWDVNLAGSALGNVWGLQSGGAAPAADAMGEEEGNILFAFIDPVTRPGFVAYQTVINGNRTYPYFTLSFEDARQDSLPVAELMSPVLEFPEDTILINLIVGYLTNPDRIQPLGLHFARARVLTAAAGSA